MAPEFVGNGRYRIGQRVGTGGTADVYAADDIRLGRQVALKILHDRVTDDKTLRARLEAEVSMSRNLRHPGIVEVFDYEPEAPAFLVMEYMPGGDLRKKLLTVGSLPPSELERIARLLLSALAFAHEQGVVHRDIKPRNILFSADGTAKLTDFGLARSVTAAGLFGDGTIAGTPEYTAPESITSSLWDPRSDLYALGCTLFESATGEPPFVANTPAEVLRLQVEQAPQSEELEGVGLPVAPLIGRLLQKDPNKRPQSASEASAMLDSDGIRGVAEVAVTAGLALSADSGGPCPTCGTPLSSHYPWCFVCGKADLPVIRESPGYTVLVTGPGKAGEKISPEHRDACVRICTRSGLDSASLEKSVPRLPFVLVRHVDYGGATRIANDLRSEGVESLLVGKGEEPRSTAVRSLARKVLTMTPRIYLVVLGMGGVWINTARSAPAAILVILGALVVGVPGILAGVFSRASAAWKSDSRSTLGENMTRLLATTRDPLIHARMQSVAESAHGIAAELAGGQTDLDSGETVEWVNAVVERSAGLCLALEAAGKGRESSRRVIAEASDGEPGNLTSDEEARTAATILRDLDTLYTRTLERIGRTSLEIRELALRLVRSRQTEADALTRGDLRKLVESLGDESHAWEEIRELEKT